MHETFQSRVVPLTLYVLDVLDRIEVSDGSDPQADEVRPKLKNLLGLFNVNGPRQQDFALAKSALVFWIDEVLVNSPWSAATQWQDNPLEREIYGSRNRAWKFFENADAARSLEDTDALEIFTQCVAMGFRGIYRGESLKAVTAAGFQATRIDAASSNQHRQLPVGEAEQDVVEDGTGGEMGTATVLAPRRTSVRQADDFGFKFPPSIDEWAGPLFTQILASDMQPFHSVFLCDSPRTARPLMGRQSLIRWSAALGVGVVLTVGLLFSWGWS
jgi:type IV/VI secretion system ImpK/VasF family protein